MKEARSTEKGFASLCKVCGVPGQSPEYSSLAVLTCPHNLSILYIQALFEKSQNAQTVDLYPPLCVKFSCRASARLQKFALIGENISRRWAFRFFQTRPSIDQSTLIGARQAMKRIPDENCASICGLFCGACPSFPDECHGCLSDYVRKGCQNCADHGFLDCAVSHGVRRCCECQDFPCEKLREFSTKPVINGICNHASVIPDSLRMREVGIPQWLREKTEQHKCPACGELITWFDMGSHRCSGQKHP